MQREFQQKLSTLSKACDVTWPEKCKQTPEDSSISSVPFVLNIYKKWNIWKLFSKHEILRELVKNCEVLLYSFLKVFCVAAGIYSLYLITDPNICVRNTDPNIGTQTHTDPNISKDSIHEDCLLILLDNRSNITLWYGTNFFIIRHHCKWEVCEISTTCHIYPTSGLQVPIIITMH